MVCFQRAYNIEHGQLATQRNILLLVDNAARRMPMPVPKALRQDTLSSDWLDPGSSPPLFCNPSWYSRDHGNRISLERATRVAPPSRLLSMYCTYGNQI